MRESIKMFRDAVDRNYHDAHTNDGIDTLVGYRYQYFSRKFKKLTGMTPSKYKRRRQLYLIILEIKNSGGTIKGSNISPWIDESSFHKTFKREFNMKPSEYIKSYDYILQEKIELGAIDIIEDEDMKKREEDSMNEDNKVEKVSEDKKDDNDHVVKLVYFKNNEPIKYISLEPKELINNGRVCLNLLKKSHTSNDYTDSDEIIKNQLTQICLMVV